MFYIYSVPLQKLLNRYYEINRNLRVYDMPVNAFKWKHFAGEIILQTVRWYLKYPLIYRILKETMAESGINVDHTTIVRWIHRILFKYEGLPITGKI